jgi:hypothetical protein
VAIKIDDIRGLIAKGGGAAFSNVYKVTFERPSNRDSSSNVNALFDRWKKELSSFNEKDLSGDSVGGNTTASWISLMADEVTLPGMQAATGQQNGMYTGSGQYNYAHTRMYNDLTISWVCDANMSPLKFLNSWMDTIFVEYDESNKEIKKIIQDNPSNVEKRSRNRSVRLNYPDEYTLQISVLKAEKDSNSETGRPSVRYVIEGAYPYSVDSVPLSMGASQLVKVSANFYYEKWYNYYTNQWGRQTTTYNS